MWQWQHSMQPRAIFPNAQYRQLKTPSFHPLAYLSAPTTLNEDDSETSATLSERREGCLIAVDASDWGSEHWSVVALHAEGMDLQLRRITVPAHSVCGPMLTMQQSMAHSSKRTLSTSVIVDSEDEDQPPPSQPQQLRQSLNTSMAASSTVSTLPHQEPTPFHAVCYYGTSDSNHATALSDGALYYVHLGSASLTALEMIPHEVCVNATAMDCWGPHGTLVGDSLGRLLLYDWRTPGPALDDGSARVPALSLQVSSSDNSAGTQRRGRRARASVTGVSPGILSCCSLDDSYRVVSGLGDSRGSVVVADLRMATTGVEGGGKRRRQTTAEARGVMSQRPVRQSPTGRPITDVQQVRGSFGQLGMVDVAGTALTMSVTELEQWGNRHHPQNCGEELNLPTPTNIATRLQESYSIQSRVGMATMDRPRCVFWGDTFVFTSPSRGHSSRLLSCCSNGCIAKSSDLHWDNHTDGASVCSISSMGDVLYAVLADGRSLCVAQS